MPRFEPYARRMFSRGRGRGRHHQHRLARPSNCYTWNTFQMEDSSTRPNRNTLPPMNVPPPKMIRTIRLEEEATTFESGAQQTNICASWLAKNRHLIKQKTPEIVIEDRDTPSSSSDDVIILDDVEVESGVKKEGEDKSTQESADRISGTVEEDDDIIFVEEINWKQKMTQIGEIAVQEFRVHSTFSEEEVVLKDGFSNDCNAFKRIARQWTATHGMSRQSCQSPTPTSDFTICSYNVLCQKTIERTNYLYKHLANSTQYLDWGYRWKGLQKELPTFNADIIGLQEVQPDHFENDFSPFLKKHGYEGVYKQKYGTVQKDDGCAIFYRPSKFDNLGYQEVNYYISSSSVSNRENIGQILVLQCKVTGEVLIIANTHLLFNEERGDVKLAQLVILFSYIHEVKKTLEQNNPLIMVMGDFNIEPNSIVYDFIVNGIIHLHGESVRTMSGQSKRLGGGICDASKFLHDTNIGMDSIFKKAISTFHKDAGAPDFIFFTPDARKGVERLQLLEKLALPTMDALNGVTPWPNKHVPSDHLPIFAKFRLTCQY